MTRASVTFAGLALGCGDALMGLWIQVRRRARNKSTVAQTQLRWLVLEPMTATAPTDVTGDGVCPWLSGLDHASLSPSADREAWSRPESHGHTPSPVTSVGAVAVIGSRTSHRSCVCATVDLLRARRRTCIHSPMSASPQPSASPAKVTEARVIVYLPARLYQDL